MGCTGGLATVSDASTEVLNEVEKLQVFPTDEQKNVSHSYVTFLSHPLAVLGKNTLFFLSFIQRKNESRAR